MEQSDTPNPTILPTPDTEARENLRALRSTATALLFGLTCIGLAVAYMLYRQVADSNRRVVEARRVVGEFQTNVFPKINWFVDSLKAFSKTNPDFNPILTKYSPFVEDVARTRGAPIPSPAAPLNQSAPTAPSQAPKK